VSAPVICARESCGHRLRYHFQDSYGDGRCLIANCECNVFIEPDFANGGMIKTAPGPEGARTMAGTAWAERHPSVAHFEKLFAYEHLPKRLQVVSAIFADAGLDLLAQLNDGPELTTSLRKLLEAKDCAVRQAVIDRG